MSFRDSSPSSGLSDPNHLVRQWAADTSALLLGLQREQIVDGDGQPWTVLAQRQGDPQARPWDLVPAGGDTWEIANPDLRTDRADVESVLPVTGSPFTPAAGEWLILKISALPITSMEIEQVATWPGFANVWEFDGSNEFKTAYIPLYRFHAEQDEFATRREIAPGVFAERIIRDGTARLFYTLVQVPESTHFRSVPDLL